MNFHLKNNYSRLRIFLLVSLLVGCTLGVLQYLNFFLNIDALLTSFATENVTPLATPLMVAVILFHTFFPGILILEEGTVKGIIYTIIIWFFYGVMIHSYASGFSVYTPLTAPFLGCIISIIRVLAWENTFICEEKKGMQKTFGSFVEPKVAELLLNNPDLFNQDGVRKNVTIMFADLRGFTKLCEDIAPEQVIAMLRDCFGKLISIVRANDGTIDKLIGDSMMVVWGNPVPVENHAEKAIDSAIEMQAMMQGLSVKWKQKLGVEIMLGIGINTAEVVAGTVGTEEFCDYTVLGSGVNLASRLESCCPGGAICVSSETYSLLQNTYSFSAIGTLSNKKSGRKVPVYKLVTT